EPSRGHAVHRRPRQPRRRRVAHHPAPRSLNALDWGAGVRSRPASCSDRSAMRSRARAFAATIAALASIAACAKSVPEQTYLQADDLVSDGEPFDRDEIVDTPSFTDAQGMYVQQIQQFFEATPYGRASFLATYQSNGVRAADAIVATAQKYGLNPLVFLVR